VRGSGTFGTVANGISVSSVVELLLTHVQLAEEGYGLSGERGAHSEIHQLLRERAPDLTGGDSFKGGFYDAKPEDNLRRTGRVYAGWGFSQAFFWDRVYTDMGHSHRLGVDLAFPTLEDFLVQYWEGHFLDRRDVNDLLSMLWTWQHGDIGQTPGFDGDHVKALQSIKAKLIAMPAVKDLYFPPEDEEYASQYIPNGEVRVIPGVWGHFAGSGDCAVDRKWIDDVIRELLAG